MHVQVFVVNNVSCCDSIYFKWRVVITLDKCTGFWVLILLRINTYCLLLVTTCGLRYLHGWYLWECLWWECCTFCYDEFWAWGTCGCGLGVLFLMWVGFWMFSRCTGLKVWFVCKKNGYLCWTKISLAERLWAIFCCNLALEHLWPCKLVLVKDFSSVSGYEEFERTGLHQSPVGVIWNFVPLLWVGLYVWDLQFVMEFYSALFAW